MNMARYIGDAMKMKDPWKTCVLFHLRCPILGLNKGEFTLKI